MCNFTEEHTSPQIIVSMSALRGQLALLVEQRRKLVTDCTRLTNRLTTLLRLFFSRAPEWANETFRMNSSSSDGMKQYRE
jgi:hypothetical protein